MDTRNYVGALAAHRSALAGTYTVVVPTSPGDLDVALPFLLRWTLPHARTYSVVGAVETPVPNTWMPIQNDGKIGV